MGEEIVPGLYAAEAEYLMQHEWAVSATDVLWRRSKLGLHISPADAPRLEEWMSMHRVC
jgi:glycerol-3-phosphate dehydrogenase